MKKKSVIYKVIFVVYIALLVYFLFFAELLGRTTVTEDFRYNLEPFKEIGRFIRYAKQLGFTAVFLNLAGNVLIFIPFGYFTGLFQRGRVLIFHGILWSFNLTLAVELLQLVARVGCFDVDDLILNTLGGAIGIILYKVQLCVSQKKKAGQGDEKEENKEPFAS